LVYGSNQDLKSTLFFDLMVLLAVPSELKIELSLMSEFFFKIDLLAALLTASNAFFPFSLLLEDS
jgi:hypothetical protein